LLFWKRIEKKKETFLFFAFGIHGRIITKDIVSRIEVIHGDNRSDFFEVVVPPDRVRISLISERL